MRSLAVLAVMFAASAAHAGPSNPAFLGIQMGGSQAGPCIIEGVTRGSAAKAAGLARNDVIQAIDSSPTPNCDSVLRVIQGHEPGDAIKLSILRMGRSMQITAELLSRAEIMRRRLVGQPMLATDLFGVSDSRSVDLSALRGKTAIVGWFDVKRCSGCTQVFGKLGDWVRVQADKGVGFPTMALAVTPGAPSESKQLTPIGLDVPLALADRDVYEDLVVADAERINFMVIDCRGIVQYVAPIAPNGDDTEAAIDELFAAAEQASRRVSK